ncbi:hypothetical protein [Streptomyces sp. NPDC056308]|uniref:hypothetical protein n=1 Tax=Streptomyces sp. NPDC056308 TaxID=3345780 RepID=UPI0035D6D03C
MSVRKEGAFADDLDLVMSAGHTQTEAVRHAVAFLAFAYRWAWASGLYPPNTAPLYMAVRILPQGQEPPGDQQV